MSTDLDRHSPDDSRTGVNSSDFLASLEARREPAGGYPHNGQPERWPRVDLAIFPGIWDALLLSVALECLTIERLTPALITSTPVGSSAPNTQVIASAAGLSTVGFVNISNLTPNTQYSYTIE
jgi:hypothetical protein